MTQQVFRVSRLSVVLLLSASGATGFVVRPAVTGQCRSGTTSSTAAGGTTTAAGPWDVGPTSSPHQSAIRRVKSPPLHPQQQGLCPSTTALGSSNVQTSEATPIAGSLHDERQQGISGAWVGEAGSLPPHFTSSPTIALVQHVLNSFEQEFDGQPLINGMDRGKLSKEEQARRMATAPFALVVHDHGCADDPIFIYATQAGLSTFGYTWEEFNGMPSRYSCEEKGRAERLGLLESVREDMQAQEFSGVRVTKTGDPFLVTGGILWNLKDKDGRLVGQAAKLSHTSPVL